MPKPIIATTLSGLFVTDEPWENAHRLWFQKMAEILKDPSVTEWQEKENYFDGVDLIMKRLYPNLTEKEQTTKARELFFESVCDYIQLHPQVKQKMLFFFLNNSKTIIHLHLLHQIH